MIRSALTSIRARLLLLVLLAVVPALGLTLYTGLEHRRMAATQAQQEALRLARFASSDHERLIEGARQLLVALASLPSVRTHDAPTCSAFFANLLKQYPLYANFGVAEPDGDIFCSALPLSGPVSVADRAYFRRAIETRDFAIGDYQIGRITGKATVNFGYPLLDEVGQVRAVVFAALDLAWLNQLVAQAQLPQGSVVTVIDGNGTVLSRYPDPERWVGKSAPESPFVKAIATQQGEGTVQVPGLEGIPRLYAFAPLRGAPDAGYVYVSIGIPTEVAFAAANRMLARNLIGLGLAGVLTLLVAWVFGDLFIVRGVRVLVNGTERLKAGDLASRIEVTGRDELGALATSFNDMADRLQTAYGQLAAHVKELERRERELSLLREIDQKLLAGVPLQDLLSRAVEAFAQLAEALSCVLVTADAESGELKPVAIYGPDPEGARRYFATLRPRVGEEGGLGRAIAMRTAILSPDIATDPQMERHRDPLLALGIRAILAVPLLTDQQVLGAVGIGYSAARSFPEVEVRAMEDFANQLAVAWEQARLREEAKGRWRLEEANRIKALFIANMSHELRTPLNSVIGFAELLQDDIFGPLTDKQRRYARHIHASGKHLLALISDILDLSKVEAGKFELRPEPLLLPDVLEAAVALLRSRAMQKGLTLQLEIEEGLPQILADPVRLRQILFNLLSNAVKFTPDGGRITVTARIGSRGEGLGSSEGSRPDPKPYTLYPGDFVEIAVADTGVGIKPEDLPRLFQPFVRLDTGLGARAEGTGLGLALTKQLVELHEGQIFVASEGEGRGSTFTVRLPLGPPGEARNLKGNTGSTGQLFRSFA